ncbi:hypothetical protein XAC3810_1080010 [Xanthomonas citri pv. citri]|uniref:Uncharacterized protein n=1 Tax=Xanthomonas citri pv. citri TaxID=611301 RepID=A0A0U4YJ54_XANCI|nr:hypothetical protein XAC2911_1010006 [Xanthomonas citri pv. citri]CEE23315.1 hypothetical protein XAC3810_1080010 [Xanthomonas citri pv. citri]CEE55080.1 hypothetical protein XACW160_1380010 [Xanthomonas citri pv. citri]CEE78002.1 hypothetical protein XACLE20_1690008 [Xanthomonas citri pv. citri]CEG15308.1 hypothetical protein XAC3562_1860010 [Xanthomonas citri pv. citri]
MLGPLSLAWHPGSAAASLLTTID